LSPSETPIERFVFDVAMNLLALLTRLWSDVAGASSSTAPQLLDRLETLCCPHSAAHSILPSLPEEDGPLPEAEEGLQASLLMRLLRFIHSETRDFMADIEDTDSAINAQQPHTPAAAQLKEIGNGEEPVAGNILDKGEEQVLCGRSLPVAELIVAALASQLVLALCKECEQVRALALSRLPRGSWWLPSRLLKAFLSLQGQTGVLLMEGVAAVVADIHWMAAQDATPAPLDPVETEAEEGKAKIEIEAKGEREGLWEESHPVLVRDASESEAMRWVWNGSDFVWCSAEVEVDSDGDGFNALERVRRRRSCSVDFDQLLAVDDNNNADNNEIENSKQCQGEEVAVEEKKHRSYRRKIISSQTRSVFADFQVDYSF